MAGRALGQWAQLTSIIINFICLLGVAVASGIFVSYELTQLKNTVTEHLHDAFPSHKNKFYLSIYLVAAVLVFVLMFPISLCKRISGIKVLSFITLLMTITFLIISFLSLFLYLPKPPSMKNIDWFNFDFFTTIQAFSLQLYPLMVQINLQPIMEDLSQPTLRREMKAFFCHQLIVSISLGLIGTFGYILYVGG